MLLAPRDEQLMGLAGSGHHCGVAVVGQRGAGGGSHLFSPISDPGRWGQGGNWGSEEPSDLAQSTQRLTDQSGRMQEENLCLTPALSAHFAPFLMVRGRAAKDKQLFAQTSFILGPCPGEGPGRAGMG